MHNVVTETTGRVRAERALAGLMAASPAVMAVYSGPDHVITYVNPAWERVVGKPGALGRPFRAVFPEMAATGLLERLAQVYATGERYAVEELPLPIQRRPGGPVEASYWSFAWEPAALPDPAADAPGGRATGGGAAGRELAASGLGRDILCHAIDVTDHVRARREGEQLLAASEAARAAAEAARAEAAAARATAERVRARLDALVRHLPAGVALFEPETPGGAILRFTADNDAFRATVGGRAVVGKTPAEAFPDLAGQGFHEGIARVFATGRAEEARGVRAVLTDPADAAAAGPEGSVQGGAQAADERVGRQREVFIDLDLVPLRDPGGTVTGVLSFHVVVTDRVRAEVERARLLAELGAGRGRLRAVILSMPSPLALHVGPEHRFELVNAAFRRISGGGRDDTGRAVRDAFPELAGQGIIEALDRVYATGEPWIGSEVPIRYDRDGTGVQDTWYNVRYEPVRDPDGAVWGVLNFAVDVTAQVRARREVERLLAVSEAARADAEAARGAAEAASRAKGEFLAVMSHELRTPLNAIGGYAELIELGLHGPVTPEQRTALDRIQRSQRALLGLINEVLNYARLETGAVTYDLADVPVAEAVAAAEALVAPQLRAKGLGYGWAGSDPGLAVRADPDKLQQVLLNLLSNAIKFTEARAGAPGHIVVSCGTDPAAPGRVVLRIQDTGVGIAADKLESVFEPFVQVDQGLTRTQHGTGLGLAISRDLARGMGGELTVESTPGVGSTFALALPRA